MERSRRLDKTAKTLMGMSFMLLSISLLLLAFFLITLKPILGESIALLFFAALFAAFSYLYYLYYIRLQCLTVREELREYITHFLDHERVDRQD
jgi:drug/metabolite transporter (DMT)-like permease